MCASKRRKPTEAGQNPFRNDVKLTVTAAELAKKYNSMSKEDLTTITHHYAIAGRAMFVRDFGKAAFVQVDDGTARFEVYVSSNDLSPSDFAEYKLIDAGDIVFAEGNVFRTNKGEAAPHAHKFHIVTKSLRPLPEKFHGMSDQELRYRMRYVDLIMDQESRATLQRRSEVVRYIREFFYARDRSRNTDDACGCRGRYC